MFHLLDSHELTVEEATEYVNQCVSRQVCILVAAPHDRVLVFRGLGEPASVFTHFPFLITHRHLTVEELARFVRSSRDAQQSPGLLGLDYQTMLERYLR